MRLTTALLFLFIPVVFGDNQEKAEKKALEQQAQAFVKEAKVLEKAGKLLEARTSYANSQSFAEKSFMRPLTMRARSLVSHSV